MLTFCATRKCPIKALVRGVIIKTAYLKLNNIPGFNKFLKFSSIKR